MFFGRNKRTERRGQISEKSTRIALSQLREGGKIKEFKKFDKHGVDFIIIANDGSEIKIQTKSSNRSALEHYSIFPNVPVVVVQHKNVKLNQQIRDRMTLEAKQQIEKVLLIGSERFINEYLEDTH